MSNNTKIDLLNDLLSNLTQGVSYKQLLEELIKYYENLEKSSKINASILIVLCFLYYTSGDYNSVLPYKNKYKNVKNFMQEEEYTYLFAIAKKFNNDPYSDIYPLVLPFFRSNSTEVNIVIQSYLIVYEKEQARFISKFYSSIKISTLNFLVGNLNGGDKLDGYISKHGWIRNGDTVILKEINPDLDVIELKKNLEFINSMTILLENNIKANNSLNSFI